jgi:hypothetical protein
VKIFPATSGEQRWYARGFPITFQAGGDQLYPVRLRTCLFFSWGGKDKLGLFKSTPLRITLPSTCLVLNYAWYLRRTDWMQRTDYPGATVIFQEFSEIPKPTSAHGWTGIFRIVNLCPGFDYRCRQFFTFLSLSRMVLNNGKLLIQCQYCIKSSINVLFQGITRKLVLRCDIESKIMGGGCGLYYHDHRHTAQTIL